MPGRDFDPQTHKGSDRIASWISAENPSDLPRVSRKTGTWHPCDVQWLTSQVKSIPGDFAEIGVYQGATFRQLVPLAAEQKKSAHAFDSFQGMDEPTAADGPQYPKGRFNIGGPGAFIRMMTDAGVPRDFYHVWPGFIPECFAAVAETQRFSFVILDVDHYRPTLESLAWLTNRITPRGLLALDDFVPSIERHATRAIREFFASDKPFEQFAFFNQQLILRRLND